jgi:hypothetical protein
MIIQWCIKGLALRNDKEARSIIDSRVGLVSNWWRAVRTLDQSERASRLTLDNLDFHVNHFSDTDTATGLPFSDRSPFISLSCGNVERDSIAKTNYVHTALRTALWFGTNFGASGTAYLYTCWVLIGARQAIEVEAVAEEIRDLNTYRRYSAYQTEGEVAAKIVVPDNHIQKCQKWTWDRTSKKIAAGWVQTNPRFTPPEALSNIRELILYGNPANEDSSARSFSGRNRR